jgi:hypothetical protein
VKTNFKRFPLAQRLRMVTSGAAAQGDRLRPRQFHYQLKGLAQTVFT